MTRTTNARVAGATFLLYIALGITDMVVTRGSSAGTTAAERLASISQHVPQVQIGMLLGFAMAFIALTLGAALYGLTREEDPDLALLAFGCRVGEGLSIIVPLLATQTLISLATSDAVGNAGGLVSLLFEVRRRNVTIAATFFAVGSTIFCWLLLRRRTIPMGLAWLGLFASILLVIAMPLRMLGMLGDPLAQLVWIPMAAFEIPVGLWLLMKDPARWPG